MASPLSRNLIAGAIGESGSLLGALPPVPLSAGEQNGVDFAKGIGVTSLAELRAIKADSLLKLASKTNPFRFSMTIDGYFLPKDPLTIFQNREEAHVPLLVGWNSQEMNYHSVMGNQNLTKENYEAAVRKLYGDNASAILSSYQVNSDADVERVATELASDRFIAFSTWRWADLQAKTGGKPVYRYYYLRPRPAMTPEMGNATPGLAGGVQKGTNAVKAPPATGAVHSAEIEYAMGNLHYNKVYAWTPDDYTVSKYMQEYFANFVKTGNPNGPGLPRWPATTNSNPAPVMEIDVHPKVVASPYEQRYHQMEQLTKK
jgi:para-nitrobenzyl esterase